MKVKSFIGLLILLIVGVFVWAKNSSKENFSQAKDLPNGALVYLQTNDLPQLIKLWNESLLKEKYLESQNFAEFQNSHLGIKLAERFADLSGAIGFSLDLQTLSGLAEKQAAVAIYDIGKLDIVFVSPLNEELFSATMFAQNSNNFVENQLEDGTRIYQIQVGVDRQRQKQKVLFANIKGRFVLATNEKLFLQTISAINGKQRLYDESDFNKLTKRIAPNLITIWVNQEKLNTDYYFKRYWLMGKTEDLQNIRAGIFDLNLNETGLTEKREFLLKERQNVGQISNAEAKDLVAGIPENVPFYHLQKVDEKSPGEAIHETLFDKKIVEKTRGNYSHNWSYDDINNYYENDFNYLNSDFEKAINEAEEDDNVETKTFPVSRISDVLSPTNPSAILTAVSPKKLENPLFVEFRKIAIILLKNPNAFQSNKFENVLIEALKNRITVADSTFVWETENNLRKLKVPMLGWEISYQLQGDKLLIANDFEFLQECFSRENNNDLEAKDFTALTVIRPANREEIFDVVMGKLAINDDDFFTGNVASLLDLMAEVKKIEIRRKANGEFLEEEILVK